MGPGERLLAGTELIYGAEEDPSVTSAVLFQDTDAHPFG